MTDTAHTDYVRRAMKTKRIINIIAVIFCTSATSFALANAFTEDDEYVARHCISEASGRPADCRAVAFVDNYQAQRRGLPVGQYVAQQHFRHMQSASRPYMRHLSRTLAYPAGYPGGEAAWSARGRETWHQTLTLAKQVNDGTLSHGCAEMPLTWGGRTVDCRNLQAKLNGDWHEVDCGETVNMFLARGHREPVPDLHCEDREAELRARREAARNRMSR